MSTIQRARQHSPRCLLCSWLILVMAGCSPSPVSEEPAGEQRASAPAMREVLSGVVENQIRAMRAGDYSKARTFAAAGLKRQFDDNTFAIMIQRGYPEIAAGGDAFFGRATDNGREAFLDVRITGRAGRQSWFRYALMREGRDWRIAGVVPIDPPVVSL